MAASRSTDGLESRVPTGPANPNGPQGDTSGVLINHEVEEGTVRYDDDAGATADQAYQRVIADHEDDVVTQVLASSATRSRGRPAACSTR